MPEHLARRERARDRGHRPGGGEPLPVRGDGGARRGSLDEASRTSTSAARDAPRRGEEPRDRHGRRRSGRLCRVIAELGATRAPRRLRSAASSPPRPIPRTASYDSAIANWFARQKGETFPERLASPPSAADPALRRESAPEGGALPRRQPTARHRHREQVQGKELSYNNIGDTEAA